jgi:predicted DNA-binding transcriptional regulator AlpA
MSTAEDSETMAMSIQTFCKRHGISLSYFYKLEGEGRGPRTINLGSRRLITIESAKEWQRRFESPAKPAAA